MTNALTLPHRLNRREMTARAVIETPKGSRSKLDYDEESGLFELAGLLPEGMSFPLDFGFFLERATTGRTS
jgi:inorganic pyrophosphatase